MYSLDFLCLIRLVIHLLPLFFFACFGFCAHIIIPRDSPRFFFASLTTRLMNTFNLRSGWISR